MSFFALTPFLWRIIKTDFLDAIVLGAVLATAYCLISSPTLTLTTATEIIPKLIGLNILFIFFGAAANRISKHIGFNAIFIAILWLPLAYSLDRWSYTGEILAASIANTSFYLRIGTLFGALMLSFIIVLSNVLILYLIGLAIKILNTKDNCLTIKRKIVILPENPVFINESNFYLPNLRAPPDSLSGFKNRYNKWFQIKIENPY